MAKPRATTIQQKFGFMDVDLKKPAHDDMIIWLNSKLTSEYIEQLIGYKREWGNRPKYALDEFERNYISAKKFRSILEGASLPPNPGLKIRDKIWEYSISTGIDNKYVVGFVDMVVRYDIPELTAEYYPKSNLLKNILVDLLDLLAGKNSVKKNSTYELTKAGIVVAKTYISPLKEQGKVIHGRVEELTNDEIDNIFAYVKSEKVKLEKVKVLYKKFLTVKNLPFDWVVEYEHVGRLFFEVKTIIPSLGELIRQIRLYQNYIAGPWFVVCKDNRFEDQLGSQGIGFIQYIP